MTRQLDRRLSALEARVAAAPPTAWAPDVQAWHAAHGWLPAGFCACMVASLFARGAGFDPAAPCGACPRATDPRHSPAVRALPVAFFDATAEGY